MKPDNEQNLFSDRNLAKTYIVNKLQEILAQILVRLLTPSNPEISSIHFSDISNSNLYKLVHIQNVFKC